MCCTLSLSHVQHFVAPWTAAHQAPLSMVILQARILEWASIPSPGDLPNPGIKPRSPSLQAGSLLFEPTGKLSCKNGISQNYRQHIYLHKIRRIYFYCCLQKTCSLAQASHKISGTKSLGITFKVTCKQIPGNFYRTVSSLEIKCQGGKQVLVFQTVFEKGIC